jgi:hypothetical protein
VSGEVEKGKVGEVAERDERHMVRPGATMS